MSITRLHRCSATAVILSCLALVGVLAGSSNAATASRGSGLGLSAALRSNIAGWLDGNVQGGRLTMSATIVLPKLKCASKTQAIVANLNGGGGGRPGSAAGEFLGCARGKARYFPALAINGSSKLYRRLAARAGDTVVLKLTINSTKTEVSVADKTTKSASKKLTAAGGTGGVCWAGDAPVSSNRGLLGVPNFGTLTFSHTVLNGQPLGTESPLRQYDRYRGKTLQIKTSRFAGDEETFKTTFKHS
jgi:hypothetical protein